MLSLSPWWLVVYVLCSLQAEDAVLKIDGGPCYSNSRHCWDRSSSFWAALLSEVFFISWPGLGPWIGKLSLSHFGKYCIFIISYLSLSGISYFLNSIIFFHTWCYWIIWHGLSESVNQCRQSSTAWNCLNVLLHTKTGPFLGQKVMFLPCIASSQTCTREVRLCQFSQMRKSLYSIYTVSKHYKTKTTLWKVMAYF